MDVVFRLASGGLMAASAVGAVVVAYGGYRYAVVRPKELRAQLEAAGSTGGGSGGGAAASTLERAPAAQAPAATNLR